MKNIPKSVIKLIGRLQRSLEVNTFSYINPKKRIMEDSRLEGLLESIIAIGK